jgi:hypothetical protein
MRKIRTYCMLDWNIMLLRLLPVILLLTCIYKCIILMTMLIDLSILFNNVRILLDLLVSRLHILRLNLRISLVVLIILFTHKLLICQISIERLMLGLIHLILEWVVYLLLRLKGMMLHLIIIYWSILIVE